jgi:hypothetical protein
LQHDEFKGRTAIERNGRSIQARTADFINPLAKGDLATTSSGSRSTGTVTRPSAEFQLYREAEESLFYRQFEAKPATVGALYPLLPSTVGIRRAISAARQGHGVREVVRDPRFRRQVADVSRAHSADGG